MTVGPIFIPPPELPGTGDEVSQAVEFNLPTTTGEVSGLTTAAVPGEYLGYSVRETSGSAAATIVLYDNKTAASGTILDEIAIPEGTAVGICRNRGTGRAVQNGVWAVITGAIQGNILM